MGLQAAKRKESEFDWHEAILLLDQDGRILDSNPDARFLFDLKKSKGGYQFPIELAEVNLANFNQAKSRDRKGYSTSVHFICKPKPYTELFGKFYGFSWKGQTCYQVIFQNHSSSSEALVSTFLDLILSMNVGKKEIDALVDEGLQFLMSQFQAAGGMVHVADYKKKNLDLAHSVGISYRVLKVLRQFRFSEGLIGDIFLKGRVRFIRDIRKAKKLNADLPGELWHQFHVRSYLGIPLVINEDSIGVIGLVFTREIKEPDAFQKNFLFAFGSIFATLIQKSRIEAREHKFFHQLSILRELTSFWRSAENFEDLLHQTARVVVERLQFWDLSFFQYLPEKGIVKKVALVGGLSDDLQKNDEQSATEGVIGWVIQNRKSKYVPDVRKEKSFFFFPGSQALSVLAIPVKIGDKVFGVITMESRNLDAYDDIDLWTMETVAGSLALYLEYILILEAKSKQLENFRIINQASQLLKSTIELGDLSKKFCDFLGQTLDLYYVSLYRYEEESASLIKVMGVGGSAEQRPVGTISSIQTGILGRVVQTKKSYYVPDVSQEPIYLPISLKDQGSEYCLPILFGEEIYGVLNIESQKVNAFDSDQLIVIQTIIDHFSKALRNALLFSQINQEKEKTEAILSNLQEGVVISNSEGRIVYSNRTAREWFPELSDRTKTASALLPFYDRVATKLDADHPQTSVDYEENRRAWRIRGLRMNGASDEGNCLLLFEDITDRKRAETKKIENERMRMAVEMAGSIAHEVNQPLTGILGFCSLLLEDLDPQTELAQSIQIIEEQATRISNLVKKFQNIVRIKTKSYLGDTEIIDIEQSGVVK